MEHAQNGSVALARDAGDVVCDDAFVGAAIAVAVTVADICGCGRGAGGCRHVAVED